MRKLRDYLGLSLNYLYHRYEYVFPFLKRKKNCGNSKRKNCQELRSKSNEMNRMNREIF